MIFECFQIFYAEDTESTMENSALGTVLQIDLAQGATVLAAKIHAVITRCQVVELKEIVEPIATHSEPTKGHSFDVSAFFDQ